MTYQYDDQARGEAADHPASDDEVLRLRNQVELKINELGPEGVRGHIIDFSKPAWTDAIRSLPAHLAAREKISRGDVFDIAIDVRERLRPVVDLFTAGFLWGMGKTGYGATRHRCTTETAGERLVPALARALDAAADDPIAGYAMLYGGHDQRAPAFQEPWARIHGYGPASFTKLLYFSIPGALILDNVVANAVYKRSGLNYLVTPAGKSVGWTPYRYAVYLQWMRQTAQRVGTEPDMLELTLFKPPAEDLSVEADAADRGWCPTVGADRAVVRWNPCVANFQCEPNVRY